MAHGRVRSQACCAVSLAAAILAPPSFADTWKFDKGYTEVRFSWDHLGVSRQSARFTDVDGTLDFSPTDPEAGSVEARIRAASLQTGGRDFDELLRKSDFFNVAAHPYVTFKSTGVKPIDARNGEVTGDLTILGITQPVTLAVRWNFTGAHPLASVNPIYLGVWVSGFSAKTTISRSAFGMKRGVPLVSDEVEITIETELVRKGE